MADVNLHQLRIFVSVVRLGNITRAAESLYMTQPAVTAQLRYLRTFAGQPLLLREGRRLVPSEAGKAVYDYASKVLQATQVLERNLGVIASGESGHVVIGANHIYGASALPEILGTICRGHPAWTISFVDGTSEQIIEQVRGEEADIGVVAYDRIPSELGVCDVGEDRLVVVQSPTRPMIADHMMTLEQASAMPFVQTAPGRKYGARGLGLDHLLTGMHLNPRRVVMEVPTWEAFKVAVRSGTGLGLAWWSIVWREVIEGDLQVLEVPGFRETLHVKLIWLRDGRRNAPPSGLTQSILKTLERELSRLLREVASVTPDRAKTG